MSEIVVVAFRDAYRALQVSSELRRLGKHWVDDLDRAIVLSWERQDQIVVQQSVNLSTGEGAGWGAFWGSFLRATLMCRHTDGLVAAARDLLSAAAAPSTHSPETREPQRDLNWWLGEMSLSLNFIRDICALIQPEDSALFLVLTDVDSPARLRQLPNYGGTLLHEKLDADQEAKLETFLSAFGPTDSTSSPA